MRPAEPSRRRLRGILSATAALSLGLAGALAVPLAASAATIIVTSNADAGPGSLRAAVVASTPGDTIQFDPGVTQISLLSAIILQHTLTIDGPGSGVLTIDRGTATPFNQFEVGAAATTDIVFEGLKIDGSFGGVAHGGVGSGFLSSDPDLRDVWFEDVTFSSQNGGPVNLTRGSGLHLQNVAGDVTLYESALFNNIDTLAAGAYLLNIGGDLLVQTTSISSNEATGGSGRGAGLSVDNAGDVTLSDGTGATSNKAGDSGGAVAIENSRGDVSITEGSYSLNSSVASSGGAFFLFNNVGDVTISATFSENDAETAGGAVYFEGPGSLSVAGSTFEFNKVDDDAGGGLYVRNADVVTLTDSIFEDNTAGTSGGGLYVYRAGGPSTVTSSTFMDNNAGNGGALAVDQLSNELTIRNSTFENNRADQGAGGADGGAIHVATVGDDGKLEIDSSTFTENTLNMGELSTGGGVSLAVSEVQAGGSVRIINSTAYEPAQGTAFSLRVREVRAGGSFELVHSTIVANGGLRVGNAAGRVSVANSIIDGNVLPVNAPAFLLQSGGPIHLAWSVVTDALDAPIVSDEGGNQFSIANLKLGPLQNNGGPTLTMLPLPGSPAIDRGDPAIVGAPSLDQRGAGFARILGGRIDVGAVEAPAQLAATGLTIGILVPILGGVLLLAGIVAIVFTRLRRTKADDRPE